MASYPWVVPHERQGQKIDDFPHLKRWLEAIAARPATVRAYAKAKEVNPSAGGIRTAEERAILFGQTAQSIAAAAAARSRSLLRAALLEWWKVEVNQASSSTRPRARSNAA